MSGSSLNAYRKNRLLGRSVQDIFQGGLGIVYVLDNGTVAKCLRDEYLCDEEARTLFTHEAEFMISCDEHPHVLKWLDLEEEDDRLYIISEYVRTGSLAENIPPKGCDPKQCACWAVQLAFAMVHMHRMGVVAHRDIKPHNILIDGGELKLADFGLADLPKMFGCRVTCTLSADDYKEDYRNGVSRSGSYIFGTPAYMAPEQFKRIGDERSDLYAFGVVFYEMLTGLFPTKHRQYGVPRPSTLRKSIPHIFDEICLRLTQLNPEDRYPSFRHLFIDIEPITQGAAGEYQWVGIPQLRFKPLSEMVDHPDFMSIGYSRSAPFVRVHALEKLGKYEEALSYIDFYSRTNRGHWLVEKSWCLGQLGRFREALRVCEEALAEEPRDAHALLNKGVCLARINQQSEAIECFRKVRQLEPQSLDALVNEGMAHVELGHLREALTCYEKAEEIDSAHNVVNNLDHTIKAAIYQAKQVHKTISLLLGEQKFEELLRFLDGVGDKFPMYPKSGLLIEKSRSFAKLGRYDKCVELLREAIEIDPTSAPAWDNLGCGLVQSGKSRKAFECFRKALLIEPTCYTTWLNIGRCLQINGHVETGEMCYSIGMVLKNIPDHVEENKLRWLAESLKSLQAE